jgi:alpha-amylase
VSTNRIGRPLAAPAVEGLLPYMRTWLKKSRTTPSVGAEIRRRAGNMGVALIAWGRFFDGHGNHVSVPAPSTEPGAPWLLDFLARHALTLRRAGFTAIQLPPTSKAQGGAGAGCDGYGVFDPRDLGSKNQQGSFPTRYGPKDALTRFVAVAHACGLDVYLDIVLHQRIGENGGPGVFRYLGADGRTLNGRGETAAGWFRGVPPDNLPDDDVPDKSTDFSFGRELSYQHCRPHRVTIEDALDYGEWVFRTTGADGARFDDVKGTWAPFVREFMTTGTMASKFFCSEYFDGNRATLNWWATTPPISGRSSVEDFTMHWALQAACDNGTARPLEGAGYASWRPDLACTFVDNPDTDISPGEAVTTNKLLAYAFLLTAEGYPLVFGKDYFPASVWPGAYGLHRSIDNLVWIHEHLANGASVTQHLDDKVIVLNRTGSPGLLTALNFDTVNARTITCATSFGPNTQLHDYAGRHPDIRTDPAGRATFTIPSNAFSRGQSYLCFSRAGLDAPNRVTGRATTQAIFGAADLDVMPAENTRAVIGRITAEHGTVIALTLQPDRRGWAADSAIRVEVADPGGHHVINHNCTDDRAVIQAEAGATGEHVIALTGHRLPASGSPFEIEITYTAPQTV